jgi:hypothetical protein
MCGRYTAAKDFAKLIKLVGVIMARMPTTQGLGPFVGQSKGAGGLHGMEQKQH